MGTTALIENQRNSGTITIKTPIKNPAQPLQRDQKISISFQEDEPIILSIKNSHNTNHEILISPHKNSKSQYAHTPTLSQSPSTNNELRRGTASTSRFEDVKADELENSVNVGREVLVGFTDGKLTVSYRDGEGGLRSVSGSGRKSSRRGSGRVE